MTRSRLLDAAEEAFVECGYDGVTVNEIVRRAGYTTGAIYNHFDGKAELLIEVVKQALDRVRAITEQVGEPSLTATYAAAVDAWFDMPVADRLLLAEVHMAASRHPDVAVLLSAAIDEAIEGGREAITAAQRRGEANAQLDPARVSRLLVVIFAGLNHIDTIDPRLVHDDTAKAYLAGWIEQLFTLPTRPAPRRDGRLARRR